MATQRKSLTTSWQELLSGEGYIQNYGHSLKVHFGLAKPAEDSEHFHTTANDIDYKGVEKVYVKLAKPTDRAYVVVSPGV